MPRLGKRLLKIAEFIPAGSRVADIGTDHAVLPIHLIRSGLASLVIATDINKKPLGKAAENIDAAALSDYITLRLGDGLSCIEPNEVDTIIIAGMGGELIADILNSAPWLKDGSYRLILQPMTRGERLREYLRLNRFTPVKEEAGLDAGRHFSVMVATSDDYSGEYPPCFDHAGLLLQEESEENLAYLRYSADLLRRRADMIHESERGGKLWNELNEAAEYISTHLK